MSRMTDHARASRRWPSWPSSRSPAEVEVGATAPSFTEVTLLGSPNALLWRGLLAVVIGIVSVSWPGITVGAFVVLFAVYAFMYAVMDGARAFSSDRVGPVRAAAATAAGAAGPSPVGPAVSSARAEGAAA